jgi:oligopeptide transport system permease protein
MFKAMIELLLKRLLAGLVTLFVVITVTFGLLRCLPGGPFDREHSVPIEIQRNLEAKYHLNEPIQTQYLIYLSNILQGDLGPSYTYKSRTVNDIVSEAIENSLTLGVLALIVGTLSGILLGTLAGMTRNVFWDGLLSLLGVSSLSMPAFIFGGFLVLLFALKWNLLPAATLETPRHYILPVLSLSLVPFAYTFLLVRTAVKETRSQTFVLIKRSFGLQENVVAIKHVLRNSLLPLVSILGPIAAALVTGSFAVEYIFAVPGLGKHFVTAVSNRDYTLVMGITILYSVILILLNTVTDIVYGMLDPRLREKAKMEAP